MESCINMPKKMEKPISTEVIHCINDMCGAEIGNRTKQCPVCGAAQLSHNGCIDHPDAWIMAGAPPVCSVCKKPAEHVMSGSKKEHQCYYCPPGTLHSKVVYSYATGSFKKVCLEHYQELLTKQGQKPESGVRADEGKLAWHLVPMHMLEGMVRVLMFGAKKYAPHNWRKGLHYSRVTNSLQRHLNAFNAGEDIDPETGLPHVDHILCNALFLKGMTTERPEMDDRLKP